MKEPNKILGENNKNLGKIIVTLAEGYQTGATDEEMDKKNRTICCRCEK